MGRRLNTDVLTNNEVIVTSSGLRGLNATIGDTLEIGIDIITFISTYVSTDSSGNSETDPQKFVMALFDTALNKPLEALFGANLTNREYTGYDLKILALDLVLLSDVLERNPD